jgi:alkyl sulfatase BDS1-like metallo-beta-lactamase superfamily hydrolase
MTTPDPPPKTPNAPPNTYELSHEDKIKAKDNEFHRKLQEHTSLFAQRMFVTERVYCFVGWNLANITIVETDNKTLVVVDTGEDLIQMINVWREFTTNLELKIPSDVRSYPVEAVILTHHHADHVGGTKFLQEKFPGIVIYGADNLDKEYQQENGLIAPIMSCRAMAQYNYLLKIYYPEEVVGLNSGIGPIIDQSIVGYVQPTYKISTQNPYVPTKITIGETVFLFVYVPSEANSEIAMYLPARKVLLSAEVIQDHTFPNLYSLRGGSFRDPSNWAKSIDCFLKLFQDAQHMVLQHGPPIINNEAPNPEHPLIQYPISEVLTRYRDAIQYVRDQTLRWAMKGYGKEEIVHLVHLPIDQATYEPWLLPFYGTVKHSIPQIYSGYIGWFEGDPVTLSPTPQSEISAKMVQLMGGELAVLNAADAEYNEGLTISAVNSVEKIELAKKHWQIASELATLIIRARPFLDEAQAPPQAQAAFELDGAPCSCSHVQKHFLHLDSSKYDDTKAEQWQYWWKARYLKAACFRQMAYRDICANWFGTYLTAAYELEGNDLLSYITSHLKEGMTISAGSQEVKTSFDELSIRLKADKVKYATQVQKKTIPTIYICVTDAQPPITAILVGGAPIGAVGYKLQIRHSVLIVDEGVIPDTAIVVAGTNAAINILLAGDVGTGFDSILNSDKITIAPAEAKADVSTFFDYFEAGRFRHTPNIYLH